MTGDPAAKRDEGDEAKTPTPEPAGVDDGKRQMRSRPTVRIPDDDVPGRPSDPPPPVSRSMPVPSVRSDGQPSFPVPPPPSLRSDSQPSFQVPPPPSMPGAPRVPSVPPRPPPSSLHAQDRQTVKVDRRDLPSSPDLAVAPPPPPRPLSEPPPSGAAALAVAEEPLPGLIIDDDVKTNVYTAAPDAPSPVAAPPPIAPPTALSPRTEPPPPSEPAKPLLAMRTIDVGSASSQPPPPPVALDSDDLEVDPPTPKPSKAPGTFAENDDKGWTPAPADVLPVATPSAAMEELGDEDLAEEEQKPPPPLRVTAPILADQVPATVKTPPPAAPDQRATVPDIPIDRVSSDDVEVDVDLDNAPSITELAEEIPVREPPPPPKPPPPEKRKSSSADSTVKSKKGRPWWEELFDDDFLRSFKRPTDKQIKREATFIEERLGLAKGASILDLACGDGRHAVALAERGYSVIGYDLSLGMLAEAADEANKANQKISFVHGDMRDLSFDAQFDGVYCWGTSFGFFDEEKNGAVVKAIHKALRPGGVFLLDVMNRDYIAARQPNLVWFEGEGCVCMDEMAVDFITSRLKIKRTLMIEDGRTREIDYSLRLFSLHEIGKMLHANGFRVVEVSGNLATPGVFFGADAPQCLVLAERD